MLLSEANHQPWFAGGSFRASSTNFCWGFSRYLTSIRNQQFSKHHQLWDGGFVSSVRTLIGQDMRLGSPGYLPGPMEVIFPNDPRLSPFADMVISEVFLVYLLGLTILLGGNWLPWILNFPIIEPEYQNRTTIHWLVVTGCHDFGIFPFILG